MPRRRITLNNQGAFEPEADPLDHIRLRCVKRSTSDEVVQDPHDIAYILLDVVPVCSTSIVHIDEFDIEVHPPATHEDIACMEIAVVFAFLA